MLIDDWLIVVYTVASGAFYELVLRAYMRDIHINSTHCI